MQTSTRSFTDNRVLTTWIGMRKVDVAIIGAGTAGLSARSTVTKQTNRQTVMS